jgi:hypothetical protein
MLCLAFDCLGAIEPTETRSRVISSVLEYLREDWLSRLEGRRQFALVVGRCNLQH